MKTFVAGIAFVLVALPLSASRVEIVLDVSGSMRASAGEISRMEAAVRAVRATVEAIDPGSNVALRLYGHRLPSEPKAASCRDTELVIPFGRLDRQRFISVVESAKPLGQTPLAFSLEQAATDFGELGDEPAAVILVSDGEESCGGDPVRVACAFRDAGLELTIHTVGFDVNNEARRQLQAVANCTGGEYRDARNAGELAQSLRELTQAGLLIDKQRESAGQLVRGGNGFQSAVPISVGTYRLDHHQRPGEYDYFALEVNPGYLVRVSQRAHEVGVTIRGDRATENREAVAGVALHGPDQKQIARQVQYRGDFTAVAGASVPAGEGGTYYVLIGQDTYPTFGIHKDSPFTIELIDATDAESGTDAGATEDAAVPIAPGTHKAWIQPGDKIDTYWFDAAAGATYQMRARPEGEVLVFALKVSDEDGVVLAKKSAPNTGAAVRVEQIQPARDGRLYATVSHVETTQPVAYTIELTAEGEASDPAATEDAATEAESAEAERSMFSFIPGGGYTCAALLVLVLLGLGGVIVLMVVLRRRRQKP